MCADASRLLTLLSAMGESTNFVRIEEIKAREADCGCSSAFLFQNPPPSLLNAEYHLVQMRWSPHNFISFSDTLFFVFRLQEKGIKAYNKMLLKSNADLKARVAELEAALAAK